MPSFSHTVEAQEIEVEFEIYCGDCGAGICSNGETCKTYRRQANRLDITPCEKCLANTKQEGHDEGYAAGLEEGKSK